MLPARVEYRLRLRSDNAPSRLGALALASGAIGPDRRAWIEQRARALDDARRAGDAPGTDPDIWAEIAEDALYAPYVARQEAEIARLRRDEAVSLAPIADYGAIAGLSGEMVERLQAAMPPTLAAAARIRHITPAALSAILVHARRRAA